MFDFKKYYFKTALIIGGGKSGIAVAKLISKKLKSNIFVSDSKKIKTEFNLVKESEIKKIINKIDFAVKSPGISNSNQVIKELKKNKIPIFSELEVSLSFSKTNNLIMITGTNGKSTTTYLTWLIINNCLMKKGLKAVLCGNIGKPVSKEILKANKNDWVVMEVSSYQLEDSTYLKPKIAAILNITPDHIEHHGSMDNYIKAKFKIFSSIDRNDFLIINGDDPYLKKIRRKNIKILKFSSKRKADSFYRDGYIWIKHLNNKIKFKPADIPGIHNIENQMASILIALSQHSDYKTIQKTLNGFKGLEHRIEFVKEVNGVKYINDSKGTNVDSTLIALKALGKRKNIWLILGGLHKNSPYTPLIPYIKKYVKGILTIGSAAPLIKHDLKGYCDITDVRTLKNAVKISSKNAIKGDIVLLSPACASFDQFKNFEDRGRKFKKFVRELV